MSIELMNFSNNPAEYAMLQGWDTNVSSWNVHQQNAYLKWSSSSTIPESTGYADSTSFASSVSSEPTMSSISSQSTNVFTRPEWKTAFEYDVRSLPYIPD